MNLTNRSFLKLLDYTPEEIEGLLDLAADLKAKKKAGICHDALRGKNIALIFEKTSTRTRAAFTTACIVSPENKILSLGYNGMPIGCDDDAMPWEREGEPLNTKYMYVCHAELNAILNSAHNNLKGARVYVTLFPCNECTKAIIQSGIAEVVYYSDKYHDTDSSVAARFMFQKAGVRLTPYQPSGRKAELEL